MKNFLLIALLLVTAAPAWGAPITALSDFDRPAGQTIVFAGLIRAGSGAPDEIYDGRTNQDQLEAGNLLAATTDLGNLTISRIRPTSTRIIINRSGGLFFAVYFEQAGALRDSTWHIQRDTEILDSVPSDAITDADFGGGFMNIRDTDFRQHARAISDGDLYIFALTMPAPAVVCPYLGAGDLSLSDFMVGSATVSKLYLGATVVCE